MIVAVFIGVWLVCGALAYGMTLHDFTENFPYMKHYDVARFMGFAGVIGLIVSLLSADHYGFRFRHLSVEERWNIYKKEFEILGREHFDRMFA